MKVNDKYKHMIDKSIEEFKDDSDYNTGSLVWWYSKSLDAMNPCRMGTVPDLGVDDWEMVVVSQDLEYYLPNDSSNSGVKRKSGPHPWESTKEGSHLNLSKEEVNYLMGDIENTEKMVKLDTSKKDSKTNKFEILYKAGVIGWLAISLLLSVSAVGNIYGLQKQVRDMENDISKLETSNAELKKNISTLVTWNNQLDANDTKNALYTQQRFAAVYEKIGLQ